MKIYEYGLSVQLQILNGGSPVKTKTYLYIAENYQNLSVDSAFENMKGDIEANIGKLEKIDIQKLSVITSTGATYTLAHEVVYNKKGEKIITPSNLIRHIHSTVFTYNTLYIDNGEVVDILGAVDDVRGMVLRTSQPLDIMVRNSPQILIDIIYEVTMLRRVLHRQTHDALNHLVVDGVLPITKLDWKLQEMIDKDRVRQLYDFISKYRELYFYFKNVCGIKESIIFQPNENINKKNNGDRNKVINGELSNNPANHIWGTPSPAGDSFFDSAYFRTITDHPPLEDQPTAAPLVSSIYNVIRTSKPKQNPTIQSINSDYAKSVARISSVLKERLNKNV